MQSILHKSPQPPALAELELAQRLAQEGGAGDRRDEVETGPGILYTRYPGGKSHELPSDSSPTERVSKKSEKKKYCLWPPGFPFSS